MPARASAAAIAALALLGTTVANAAAADRYLAPTTPGASVGCLDPAAPCTNLDTALDASSSGDTIHLAAGTYDASNMGSRTVDVAGVTLAGPRAGEPAPGRTGAEALLPAGAPALGVTASGVTIDGLAIAPGSVTALEYARGSTVRNTIAPGATFGMRRVALGSGSVTTIEGNAISGTTALQVNGGEVVVAGNALIGVNTGLSVAGSTTIPTITGNDLQGASGVAIGSSGGVAEVHGNRFAEADIGILSASTFAIDAEDNWWGCNAGPGASGCTSVDAQGTGPIDADPWLVLRSEVDAEEVYVGGTVHLDATIGTNSDGVITGLGAGPLALVDFVSPWGSFEPAQASLVTGAADTTWTAPPDPLPGGADLRAQLDGQFGPRHVVTVDFPPVATLTPRTLDFGEQAVATTSDPQTVTVENTGGSVLEIDRLSGKDAGASLFKVSDDTCTGASLDRGETCTFDVRFAPSTVGDWRPRIEVLSNVDKKTVRVMGSGVKPLAVGPSSFDFGAVQRRTSSSPRSFVVTNRSPSALPVTLAKSGAGRALFAVDMGTCDDGPLAPGATCSFAITFTPQAVGSWSPTIDVQGGGRTTTVPITGQGVT